MYLVNDPQSYSTVESYSSFDYGYLMVKDLIIRIIWFSILVSSYECLELSDISSLGQGLEPRVLESTSIQSH